MDGHLKALPKVHLGPTAPRNSRYWRWHSEGNGMLCTLEAVYAAAFEVTAGKLGKGNDDNSDDNDNDRVDANIRKRLEQLGALFHLFGLQRCAIEESKKRDSSDHSKSDGRKKYKRKVVTNLLPWEEGHKSMMRNERRHEMEQRALQRQEARKESKEERRKKDARNNK